MPTTVLGTEIFRSEAQRRLIDAYTLGILLGLRSRQAIWARVERGELPPPVYTRDRTMSLWDRDAIELPDRKEG
jgi:hypothetical protein